MSEKIRAAAEKLRLIARGAQGLSLDDDSFSGLIHIDDLRERTRINEHELYSHTYMRLLAQLGGDEWSIMKEVADHEDTYLIALQGEQRREAILMNRAKAEIMMAGQPMVLPQVQTEQPLSKPKDVKEAKNK